MFLSRENARPDKEVVLQRKESHLYNTKEVGVFEGKDMEPNQKSIYNQGMKLLGRDSALLFLCIFVVAIIHASDLTDNPNYSLFSLIFEVIRCTETKIVSSFSPVLNYNKIIPFV